MKLSLILYLQPPISLRSCMIFSVHKCIEKKKNLRSQINKFPLNPRSRPKSVRKLPCDPSLSLSPSPSRCLGILRWWQRAESTARPTATTAFSAPTATPTGTCRSLTSRISARTTSGWPHRSPSRPTAPGPGPNRDKLTRTDRAELAIGTAPTTAMLAGSPWLLGTDTARAPPRSTSTATWTAPQTGLRGRRRYPLQSTCRTGLKWSGSIPPTRWAVRGSWIMTNLSGSHRMST